MKAKFLSNRAEALDVLDRLVETGCDDCVRPYILGMSDELDDSAYGFMEASGNSPDDIAKFFYLAKSRGFITLAEMAQYSVRYEEQKNLRRSA